MYRGYFDESGSFDESPGIFCVAGYLIENEAAKAMDVAWGEVLKRYEVPYFHMVDCAPDPGNGVFRGMDDEVRTALVTELMRLIHTYTAEGFAWVAEAKSHARNAPETDVYSEFVSYAVSSFGQMARNAGIKNQVHFFFEAGHKNKGNAYNKVAEEFDVYAKSMTFAGKSEERLLQAADLLAWQCTKYIKDRESDARAPRGDFKFLMQHPHTFFFLNVFGSNTTSIELAPLNSRAQKSSLVRPRNDGPLTYFLEEGSDLPLLVVNRVSAIGRALGNSRQVTFECTGEKEFKLVLDEKTLNQAIAALLELAREYIGTNAQTAFAVQGIKGGRSETGQSLMKIQTKDGFSVFFVLSDESRDELRRALEE